MLKITTLRETLLRLMQVHTCMVTLLFLAMPMLVLAQSSYDSMKPFGFATCTSRSATGYNLTGGGAMTVEQAQTLTDKKVITLQATDTIMDSKILDAVTNYDVIIFDGSKGDFVLKYYVTLKGLKDKTLIGTNGATLATKWYASASDVAALEEAGVSGMSTSGNGGTLSNGTSVAEEAEYNTRKIMIERYGDSTEWWRKSGIFYITGCENLIIRNLNFQGPGAMDLGGADLVSIIDNCEHIWIDHCDFQDGQDGNMDITNQSDFVTVSWCRFHYSDRSYMHQNTNLCGSSDSKSDDDDKLSITWAYNQWGDGCKQRMPMARYGRFHMLNNYYTSSTASCCINPRTNSEFLIEGNYFDASVKYIYSENDEESLIDWYVATEITDNWDGLYSIYNYRYPGDGADTPATRMFWGPMWDYDLAYGNNYETYDKTYFPSGDFYDKLLADNNFNKSQVAEYSYRRFQPLIQHMWDDPWFALNVQRKLNKLIDGGLESYLLGKIDEMKEELSVSAAKNFVKWPLTSDPGYYYSGFGSTWDAQVTSLKSFISTRLSTLKSLVDSKNTTAKNRYYLQKETNTVATESGVNVVLKRTANANVWTTVCLPVAVSSSVITDWFGAGAKVCQFSGVTTSGNKATLNFTTVSSMTAGVPYFVKPTRNLKVDYTFLSTSTTGTPSTVTKNSYSFNGVYSPYTFDTTTGIYFDDGEMLLGNSAEQSINGMRAYITAPDGVDAKTVSLNIDGEVFAFKTTVTREVTPGTYESFCLPYSVKVSDLKESFDKVYCLTGSSVQEIPSYSEEMPSAAKVSGSSLLSAQGTQAQSKDFSSYEKCQAPFALWQNTDNKKLFHVFMVGMADKNLSGEDNVIPAGTPFYGLVKEGVEKVTFSGTKEIDDESKTVSLNVYNYQSGVSTSITISEVGSLTDYNAEITTSESVDSIVKHYDKGTWNDGGWDTVVSMVKSVTVGDVNHDGTVNMADVTQLIKYLNDNSSITIDKNAADIDDANGNTPDKDDVQSLGDMIIEKSK